MDRSALSQRIAAGADREKVIDTLARDLRFAWRSLRRTPVVTVVAVLSIAIGVAAASDMRQPIILATLAGLVGPYRWLPVNMFP